MERELDFGRIESDYEFFMRNSTEAENDVRDYLGQITGFAEGRERIRMLDFGCGNGEFTEQFLTATGWPANRLELVLIEPVREQLPQAAQRNKRFSSHEIVTRDSLADVEAGFDLVMTNHVLYFVDDLQWTLTKLTEVLNSNGRLLLAIDGQEHALIKLWNVGFDLLNETNPWNSAEDVERVLQSLQVDYRKAPSHYVIEFDDTRENRTRILRFLFERNLKRLPLDTILKEFDQYAVDGRITMPTHSYHFVVG